MILYTSAIKHKRRNPSFRSAMVYLAAAGFCVLFDRVYALFGHGVYSAAMSMMFLYPLLGGVLPFMLLWMSGERIHIQRFAFNSYNSGIAALTVGSMLQGVMEIAGTSSAYLNVFYIGGWGLAIGGVLFTTIHIIRSKRS